MKKKVMLVDDNEMHLKMVKFMLISKGFDVETAENGKVALEALKSVRPDLIILDLAMPEMDGEEFFENIKKNGAFRNIPVLILSANLASAAKDKLTSLGASGYFVKPFRPGELVDKVKELLG